MVAVAAVGACSDDADVAPIEVPPAVAAPGTEEASEEESPEPEQAETGYRQVDGPAGAVEGVVRWRGARPSNPVLDVHMQHAVCGRVQQVPAVAIGRGGGVAGAVVSVEGIESGPRAAPSEPAVLDQVGCRYEPHVLAMMEGQPLTFRNSDDVLHNVHAIWEDGSDWFNVGQPRQGTSSTRTPERTGVARVVCDAGHAWMLAWVLVLRHPYFAVTDAEGRFRIEGVPAGAQRLRLWHQGWETVGQASGRPTFTEPVIVEQAVEVPSDGSAALELTLPVHPPETP